MKEMISFHDDAEKRLGIFLGLGAFILSSMFALFQGLSPEGFLLRGVVVLILFSLMGWAYGVWLKKAIEDTKPKEELPSNMERRSRNAESLDEGSVVMPSMNETVVMEEAAGQVVNFTLPELSPMDDAPLAGAPMIPSRNVAMAEAEKSAAAASAALAAADEGDLPPPAVPSWLK